MVEHLTFNQVVPGSNPGTLSNKNLRNTCRYKECGDFLILVIYRRLNADVAELADALDLGSSGLPVQVQVLSSASCGAKWNRDGSCFAPFCVWNQIPEVFE